MSRAESHERCPGRESHPRFRLEGPTSWLLDDWDNRTAPRPGLEPGLARLEGECSSIERAGRRAERESNPRTRFCRPRSSQRIGSERAAGIEPTSAVWKTAVLPLNDARK
jgi:hypothetical protein